MSRSPADHRGDRQSRRSSRRQSPLADDSTVSNTGRSTREDQGARLRYQTIDPLLSVSLARCFRISLLGNPLTRLLPHRSNSIDGKKHVRTVPVRLRKAQNDEHSKHEGTHMFVDSATITSSRHFQMVILPRPPFATSKISPVSLATMSCSFSRKTTNARCPSVCRQRRFKHRCSCIWTIVFVCRTTIGPWLLDIS